MTPKGVTVEINAGISILTLCMPYRCSTTWPGSLGNETDMTWTQLNPYETRGGTYLKTNHKKYRSACKTLRKQHFLPQHASQPRGTIQVHQPLHIRSLRQSLAWTTSSGKDPANIRTYANHMYFLWECT